MRRNEIDGISG